MPACAEQESGEPELVVPPPPPEGEAAATVGGEGAAEPVAWPSSPREGPAAAAGLCGPVLVGAAVGACVVGCIAYGCPRPGRMQS